MLLCNSPSELGKEKACYDTLLSRNILNKFAARELRKDAAEGYSAVGILGWSYTICRTVRCLTSTFAPCMCVSLIFLKHPDELLMECAELVCKEQNRGSDQGSV